TARRRARASRRGRRSARCWRPRRPAPQCARPSPRGRPAYFPNCLTPESRQCSRPRRKRRTMPEAARPSLYRMTQPLLRRLIADAAAWRWAIETTAEGCPLIDAGIDCPGGIAAGLRIAEICLGGLGSVTLGGDGPFRRWPWSLSVHAAHPVLACLGSQLAG